MTTTDADLDLGESLDNVDDAAVLSESNASEVSVEEVITPPAADDIILYKTERRYNIDIPRLASAARDNIENVRTIAIPALVKMHKIGRDQFESPTLSEVGGGVRTGYCQVIAGNDGRPVSVDYVHFINTDPKSSSINHGTASVGIGSFFAVGWQKQTDIVILIYEIIHTEELQIIQRQPEDFHPVAKLTCSLVGYTISNWKTRTISVPDFLKGLLAETHNRLRNDTDIPFYLDTFRMIKMAEDLAKVTEEAIDEEAVELIHYDEQFMNRVMSEILDIRFCQYAILDPSVKRRRVPMLRLVETLQLGETGDYVDITLVPVRQDGRRNTLFRVRLNHDNFDDPETGRMLLERGLVLGMTSFDRLKIELQHRRNKVVTVHLSSFR